MEEWKTHFTSPFTLYACVFWRHQPVIDDPDARTFFSRIQRREA
jgi:hypothetical protein